MQQISIRFQQSTQLPLGQRLLVFVGWVVALALPISGGLWLILPERLRDLGWGIGLYCCILIVLWQWGQQFGDPWRWYSITPGNGIDMISGLSVGSVGMLCLYGLQGLLGWLVWRPIELLTGLGTVFYALLLGLVVAWVEELLFRGWLVNELRREFPWPTVYGLSAVVFASLHFIKPWDVIRETWLQWPGLVLIGLILTHARRQRSLLLSVGLHAGWVASYSLISILDWVDYSGRVPAWVTGVGNNPLAGALGLGFLLLTGMGLHIYYPGATRTTDPIP